MARKAIPLPNGFHSVMPYLMNSDPQKLISFLEQTFGGKLIECMKDGQGTIMHAEVRIGDSVLMVGGAGSRYPAMTASNYLYVDDIDAAYQRALAAGATSLMEPADQFYGDRSAGVKDTQGNLWWIATHFEDVPADELERRAKARSG